MNKSLYILLENRGILEISGKDARHFLQGIITNDINNLSEKRAIYSCMLTPQGKFLFDFFIVEMGGKIYLDCEKSRLEELKKRLTMYKLRADVAINDVSETYEAAALLGENVFSETDMAKEEGATYPFCKGIAYIDPRTKNIYARALIERENDARSFEAKEFAKGKITDYEKLRISLGIPDSAQDIIAEKSFPLHSRMEEMNAISFKKGCYVGQEVTSRTKHMGVIRKNLFVVNSNENLPDPGAEITKNGKNIGTLRSVHKNTGIALLEVEAAQENSGLSAENIDIKVV